MAKEATRITSIHAGWAGPDLHDRVLFTEPFVGYVAPSHRLTNHDHLTPADLSIEDLWLLSEGRCFRDQVLQVCGRAPSVPQAAAQFESGSLETLVRLVRNSGGMTLLPQLAIHHMSNRERTDFVIPFADPPPTRDVRLVTRRRHKQRLVEAFVDTLSDALPATVTFPDSAAAFLLSVSTFSTVSSVGSTAPRPTYSTSAAG